jgi:2-oxoglutarate dehydrogenase complex dehydrogenase (E1) component-like enzyme
MKLAMADLRHTLGALCEHVEEQATKEWIQHRIEFWKQNADFLNWFTETDRGMELLFEFINAQSTNKGDK